MRLDIIDLVEGDGTNGVLVGAVSYKLYVTSDGGAELARVPVTVANPTPANIRAANKKAIRDNLKLRLREIVERQSDDLEKG